MKLECPDEASVGFEETYDVGEDRGDVGEGGPCDPEGCPEGHCLKDEVDTVGGLAAGGFVGLEAFDEAFAEPFGAQGAECIEGNAGVEDGGQ